MLKISSLRLISSVYLFSVVLSVSALAAVPALPVTVVQFPIRDQSTEASFFAEVEQSIVHGKAAGSKLIVFPELLSLGMIKFGKPADERRQLESQAVDLFPRYLTFVKALSKRENVSILAGSLPRKVGAKIRNTAIYVEPSGREILQDKLFPTVDEVKWGWEGGKELNVFQTDFGNWVILICYDAQFAELSSLLDQSRPTLILVPSMTEPKGLNRVRFGAQARAVEHHAFVIVAGAVSAKAATDTEYYGQNVILPPQEKGFPNVIAEGPLNVPALTNGVLDFNLLTNSRVSTGIYPSRDFGTATQKGKVFRVVLLGK